jgi:hypothetical protein
MARQPTLRRTRSTFFGSISCRCSASETIVLLTDHSAKPNFWPLLVVSVAHASLQGSLTGSTRVSLQFNLFTSKYQRSRVDFASRPRLRNHLHLSVCFEKLLCAHSHPVGR